MDDLNFIDKILSSDFLKMTDAERTQILQEKEMKSKEMVAEITKKTERYRDIISFRKMQYLKCFLCNLHEVGVFCFLSCFVAKSALKMLSFPSGVNSNIAPTNF